MKKRLLFLALMIVLVVSLFCVTASAAIYSGSCGESLTWCFDSASDVLNISGNGAMDNYTDKKDVPWYSHRRSIETVVIEESVATIGDYAFYFCDEMPSVTFGNGVTTIGKEAFEHCDSLASVTIGRGVTTIGRNAFTNWNLEEVHISDLAAWCQIEYEQAECNPIYCSKGNVYIDGEAVTDLVIPDTVTSIGKYAFSGYSALRSCS